VLYSVVCHAGFWLGAPAVTIRSFLVNQQLNSIESFYYTDDEHRVITAYIPSAKPTGARWPRVPDATMGTVIIVIIVSIVSTVIIVIVVHHC
jgi:hypothetical protein